MGLNAMDLDVEQALQELLADIETVWDSPVYRAQYAEPSNSLAEKYSFY